MRIVGYKVDEVGNSLSLDNGEFTYRFGEQRMKLSVLIVTKNDEKNCLVRKKLVKIPHN